MIETRHIGVVGADLVVAGLEAVMTREVGSHVVIVGVGMGGPSATDRLDLVLYAAPHLMDEEHRLLRLCEAATPARVGLLSDDLTPARVERARDAGVSAFVSALLPAPRLAVAVVRALEGMSPSEPAAPPIPATVGPRWPGDRQGLSRRESQVLLLVAEGLTNREIASTLFLSPETVKGYLRDVFAKLGLRNRVAAAAYVHATSGGRERAGTGQASDAPRPVPGV
jgi:NarL family two-component system response regulator LiaR